MKGVFLSYASDDAPAAARICAALRAAGLEVWFDQSELRGGDAWDAAIRRQIKTCALFIPVISQTTRARGEGYFRLEWKLAIDRSHLMASNVPFLVPVVIDDIPNSDERVPDRFREVQWSRLAGGNTPVDFVARIQNLLGQVDDPAARPLAGLGSAASSTAGTSGASTPPTSHFRILPWALGAAVIALAGAGFWAYQGSATKPNPSTATQTPPAAESPVSTHSTTAAMLDAPIPEKSIAVLPFENMSSDKDQEYFSDGLSEELIDQLSKIPDLRVPARTSSFYFKGKSDDIAVIARKLHVANILEGSVRKSGNRLRVTAELIRADNGYHVWSETYDRDSKDVFKVQDDIAGAVVAALKTKLSPAARNESSRTTNPQAYNQYLLGRKFANDQSWESRHLALEAFRKAVALDPNYADAYAALSSAEFWVADTTADAAGYQRAREDAAKAVALAPDHADGYSARAFMKESLDWDWAGAQADTLKALELEPSAPRSQRGYASLLEKTGRIPEAIAVVKRTLESDPLSNAAWLMLGGLYEENGDYVAAADAMHRALEISPSSTFSNFYLGALQLEQSDPQAALASFRKVDFDVFRLTGIAVAEHSLGDATASQAALDEIIAKHSHDAAAQIAEVYAWRNEKDKAFEWLDRAFNNHDGGLNLIKIDLFYKNLRADPRYPAFLRKMNLPT